MEAGRAPIFVLCCARSGSTLLRYILDTHPEIAAPPELHLLLAARQLAWVFEHTTAIPGRCEEEADAKRYASDRVRDTISAIMQEHATRAGKSVWADKSVSSVDFLDLLEVLYPEARLLLLHRQAPDVMASCAQTAQFQQGAYGFEPFVARTPGNTIDGLADYWIDKARRLLEAEKRLPNPGLRVRYEDLVRSPTESLAGLFTFLELQSPTDLLDSVFSTPHIVGPGDSKILQTTGVHTNSIGHGRRLAMDKLSSNRREQINVLHAELGYLSLDNAP